VRHSAGYVTHRLQQSIQVNCNSFF